MKNLIKNALLALISLFAALAAIETVLYVSGKIYHAYRIDAGPDRLQDGDTVRVLCIGDSFTFGAGAEKGRSYPEQLEILMRDKKMNDRFSVFNAGICGATSSLLVKNLEENLRRYSPDILIVLIGCNETVDMFLQETDYFRFKKGRSNRMRVLENFSDLRVAKLFKRGLEGLAVTIWKHRLGAQCNDDKSRRASEQKHRQALSIDGQKTGEFYRLIRSGKGYLNEHSSDVTLAAEEYKKAIQIMPDNEEGYLCLAQTYLHLNKLDLALAQLETAKRLNPHNQELFAQLWVLYYRMGKADLARDALERYLCLSPLEIRKYLPLLNNGFPPISDTETFEKALFHNLKKIADEARRRKIKVVLMNYPGHEWPALEKFTGENGIPFIDQRLSFKELELREGYQKNDYFAEDGHCKNKGYAVMAENVFNLIKEMFDGTAEGRRGKRQAIQ
ncbi:MAG: GDSL-type esterase/lipase family protein, partial [Candidatus Omnitrophica bacterium]|nr:GDSL-type esterase/lipase family protein [Candidatus Omnitrophota bacterium]